MQVAGTPHTPPDADYEMVTGHPWPPGYQDEAELREDLDRLRQR